MDSYSLRAVRGDLTGANPVDRAKSGSTLHVAAEASGLSVVFEALLDDLPVVRRSYLARRGIKVRIARRGIESSTRLGRHRWKAERTIAWLAGCRRLRVL